MKTDPVGRGIVTFSAIVASIGAIYWGMRGDAGSFLVFAAFGVLTWGLRSKL